jgi:hypothetical protein
MTLSRPHLQMADKDTTLTITNDAASATPMTTTMTVRALETVTVFDATDMDSSGMRVVASDGARLAAVWAPNRKELLERDWMNDLPAPSDRDLYLRGDSCTGPNECNADSATNVPKVGNYLDRFYSLKAFGTVIAPALLPPVIISPAAAKGAHYPTDKSSGGVSSVFHPCNNQKVSLCFKT